MVLFLYSDKNCEHQAISCIKSLTHKITDDVKIVYYTVGFESDFKFKNLYKFKVPLKSEYPTFHFYKADLSLVTMDLFPNEHYIFTDTDVLFSRRFDFEKTKHSESYPIASFGPHEYPFMWREINGERRIYNELPLMKYLNVSERSQRYVWSCFYSFNSNCKDFFEEYTSICKNRYLMDKRDDYFPYADETAFNVCLWKRNATKNYGFGFVNTHLLETVRQVEDGISNKQFENTRDAFGNNWEYVDDSSKVMLYHGFKEKEHMETTVNYLINL
jgi:hypothetical protein